MDEDTYPFFGPLGILKVTEDKKIMKSSLTAKEVPIELLIYFIADDNKEDSLNKNQISIDKLLEEKKQIGKYFNMRYSRLVEMLLEAENKRYIALNNNFGNRYIEFLNVDYVKLLRKYFMGKEA